MAGTMAEEAVRPRRAAPGFTLIEPLVVIAIIAGNHTIPADELAKFNATGR